MAKILDVLFLLALPASGKSEISAFLRSMNPELRRSGLHLGEMIELDDFPYVHMMRRIDEELTTCGKERFWFHAPDKSFKDPRAWAVLVELINEDYADLIAGRIRPTSLTSLHLLRRYNRAAQKVGMVLPFSELMDSVPNLIEWEPILLALGNEAKDMTEKFNAKVPRSMEGKTVIIEIARGGPKRAKKPLFWGYQRCLGLFSPDILKKAGILYVWVTPSQSYQKNLERADPNDPASILKHCVPIEVMLKDYGCDDINHLLKMSGLPGLVRIVSADGGIYYLPCAKLDNRVDKTSFVRGNKWGAKRRSCLVRCPGRGLPEALEGKIRGHCGLALDPIFLITNSEEGVSCSLFFLSHLS